MKLIILFSVPVRLTKSGNHDTLNACELALVHLAMRHSITLFLRMVMDKQKHIAQKSATLDDIAARAGVSRMAVSVVLNGSRSGTRVSQATRQRILDIAKELNYRPNSWQGRWPDAQRIFSAFIAASTISTRAIRLLRR